MGEDEPPPGKPNTESSSSSSSKLKSPKAADYASSCKTSAAAKTYAARFKVPPEYELRAPTADERAHNPPPGYAAIYLDHFKNGLRLPLPPFVVSVLSYHKIALAQLHPRGIFSLLRFMALCSSLEVDPTVALFRHHFKIRKNYTDTDGWFTFCSRKAKVVRKQAKWRQDWKESFFFFKTKNVAFSWNHSPVMNVPLAENEKPPAGIIRKFEACLKHASKEKAIEPRTTTSTESRKQKRFKTMAECNATARDDVGSGQQSSPIESGEEERTIEPTWTKFSRRKRLKTIAELHAPAPEQFSRNIHECASSFNRLQRDKEHLEKVVEAKEKDKVELQKMKVALEHDVEDKDDEIASLQEDKAELQKQNGLLKSEVSKLQDVVDSLQVDKVELQKITATLQKML